MVGLIASSKRCICLASIRHARLVKKYEQRISGVPSKKFVENTISLCGERGDRWLNDLPATIEALGRKWAFDAGSSFRDLSFNFVTNVILANGSEAVLKIGLPLTDVEIYGEAAYLRSLDGYGAVRLLEFDREFQAILLERIKPGENLKSICKRDQAEAVSIAIRILKRVIRPVPADKTEFIILDDWFDGLRRASGTTFPQEYAERALEFYSELCENSEKKFLLHGDLHHDNILSSDREPFFLIDPKGIIGHNGYDIGVFLNNHRDWLEWDTRLDGKLDQAVAAFALAFELDERIIGKWAYCQMVLSWWWMFDEMPEIFGDELGLTDIWKV